jgi:hypothetical protein
VSLYTLGKTGVDAANGFRLVVEAMLQSPFFLYHHDVGATATPQAGTVAITPYELASRLSYFLWNTMPDDTLFARAADRTLTTDSVLAGEVQRMLASDKAAGTISLFHRQWLDISELLDQTKDATVYPRYNAQLGDAMMQELALYSDYVVRKGDGLLKTLLTSNVAFPQGGLFSIYGMTQPSGYTVGTPVTLDATQRAGILTQAAFLTRWSHGNQTSPVHRGKLVRLNVMCGYIMPPPANVNTTPPVPTAATSTRERFSQHQANPECSSCHVLMDPIGLGFETFDGIGAFRTMDGLGAVDATGNVVNGGPDLDGVFRLQTRRVKRLGEVRLVQEDIAGLLSTKQLFQIGGTQDFWRLLEVVLKANRPRRIRHHTFGSALIGDECSVLQCLVGDPRDRIGNGDEAEHKPNRQTCESRANRTLSHRCFALCERLDPQRHQDKYREAQVADETINDPHPKHGHRQIGPDH